jgi:hypothetical protein
MSGLCEWTTDVKVGIKEAGCQCVKWIHLARDTVQWWATMNMEPPPYPNACSEYNQSTTQKYLVSDDYA